MREKIRRRKISASMVYKQLSSLLFRFQPFSVSIKSGSSLPFRSNGVKVPHILQAKKSASSISSGSLVLLKLLGEISVEHLDDRGESCRENFVITFCNTKAKIET